MNSGGGWIALVQGVSIKAEGLNPIQWCASMFGVLIVIAAPFAAWFLSAGVLARLFHI